MDTLKLRRGSGKAVARRTGPNDTFRIVWAILFIFSLCFIYTNYLCNAMLAMIVQRDGQEVAKRMSPASFGPLVSSFFFLCFFFIFFCVFLFLFFIYFLLLYYILNLFYRFY